MLNVPNDMRTLNSYIECEIPSAKDLYERMGFRYVTGLGHNSVENAENAMFAASPRNSSAEALYGVDSALEADLNAVMDKQAKS